MAFAFYAMQPYPAGAVRRSARLFRRRDSRPRSSPARRSPAACSCPTSAACSLAARRCSASAPRSAPRCVAAIGGIPQFWVAGHAARLVGTDVLRDHTGAPVIPERPDRGARTRRRCCRSIRLLASSGAVVTQPVLGKVADVLGLSSVLHLGTAAIQALALPFIWRARRERAAADGTDAPAEAPARAARSWRSAIMGSTRRSSRGNPARSRRSSSAARSSPRA